MNTFTLPIGDWSHDGHGQCENILIETEFSKEKIMEAYLKTVKKLKLCLHSNNEYGAQEILVDYEESTIPDDAAKILLDAGCRLVRDSYRPDDVVDLFCWFVKQSLPEFEANIVKPKYLFGFWDKNKKYNFQVGYGVFNS